ncbi:MAG: 50S ribosomal protein L29 [Sedimentisphaerales bacterium]|nr:50S ribosomal protein L29 [Sedimentisphaerales bacterium]
MKASEYREMSTDELELKIQELEKHLFDLRSQAATEKLQDCKSVINTRREIARIKTVLRQRQIEAERQEPAVKGK